MPRERRVAVNDIELCCFEWGTPRASAERNQGSLLLVHATGFHARCWDQVVASVLQRQPHRHVVAVDSRGHGRSDKIGPFDWDVFGEDLSQFVDALDLHQVVGVGHSMGGHCVTQAAAHFPDRFERLVLVDPVIMSPESYSARASFMGATSPAEHPTAKRRNHWRDADEMFERFRDRVPFAAWQPQVLKDYCDWGVLPDPSGKGFNLACPPQVEASVYLGSARWDIFAAIERIEIPVTVLRARPRAAESAGIMDFSSSPTWPELAKRFKKGQDLFMPERSHFIPMEDPALVASLILDEHS